MSLKKNFYDKSVPTKNLVTTISGVILLVVTLLATLGVITSDQAAILQTQLGVLGGAVTAIIGVVSAIILMFKAKDV